MRRCPQEQHQRQDQRDRTDGGIDGGRAREHGKAAGQTAEHDVEPGAPLEPDRVHHRVEEGAEKRIQRSPRIERPPGRSRPLPPPAPGSPTAMSRVRGSAPVTNGRLRVRFMRRVDVALDVLIESARGCRGQQHGQPQQRNLPRRQAPGRAITASPASAVNAMTTPMRSLNSPSTCRSTVASGRLLWLMAAVFIRHLCIGERAKTGTRGRPSLVTRASS